jgi:crotonobetainyl-CoA:carnitine CoA-transferase CaiB-like acyl-CoA transferase
MPELIDLNLDARDRAAATRLLAQRLVAAGRVSDLDGFLADVAAREAQMPTGLEAGSGFRTRDPATSAHPRSRSGAPTPASTSAPRTGRPTRSSS